MMSDEQAQRRTAVINYYAALPIDREELDDPDFKHFGDPGWQKVHNWRNYIPHEMVALWADMTAMERRAAAAVAQQAADAEEWD